MMEEEEVEDGRDTGGQRILLPPMQDEAGPEYEEQLKFREIIRNLKEKKRRLTDLIEQTKRDQRKFENYNERF